MMLRPPLPHHSPRTGLLAAILLLSLAACRGRNEPDATPGAADSALRPAPVDTVSAVSATTAYEPGDHSGIEECTEPRWSGTDSVLATLHWSNPGRSPDLGEILRRSEELVSAKMRISQRTGCRPHSTLSLAIPFEDSLVASIRSYGSLLAAPSPSTSTWPSQTDSAPYVDSSMVAGLPKVAPSKTIGGRAHFFLGGFPLLSKELSEQGAAHTDLDGKPEFRYSTTLNAAANRLVVAMRAIPGTRLDVRHGPSLDTYESGSFGVGQIGSLDHVATTMVRAWFLTRSGPVPARVVSVRHKLFQQDLCVSHLPRAVFASASAPGDDILGIYIPQDGKAPARCQVVRSGKLTTIDLDGDGIPEYAAVVEPFEAIAGDMLDRAAWFVNEGGTWKPIDAGSHEDCT
ncbi:MAG: hypothetical protein IPO40_06605 [Fibrobacteres bacterium]|nr:hypothetical protein [Fibrobacterota bacterium]